MQSVDATAAAKGSPQQIATGSHEVGPVNASLWLVSLAAPTLLFFGGATGPSPGKIVALGMWVLFFIAWGTEIARLQLAPLDAWLLIAFAGLVSAAAIRSDRSLVVVSPYQLGLTQLLLVAAVVAGLVLRRHISPQQWRRAVVPVALMSGALFAYGWFSARTAAPSLPGSLAGSSPLVALLLVADLLVRARHSQRGSAMLIGALTIFAMLLVSGNRTLFGFVLGPGILFLWLRHGQRISRRSKSAVAQLVTAVGFAAIVLACAALLGYSPASLPIFQRTWLAATEIGAGSLSDSQQGAFTLVDRWEQTKTAAALAAEGKGMGLGYGLPAQYRGRDTSPLDTPVAAAAVLGVPALLAAAALTFRMLRRSIRHPSETALVTQVYLAGLAVPFALSNPLDQKGLAAAIVCLLAMPRATTPYMVNAN